MLDEYIIGKKYRISDEAPVPILKVDEFKVKLGGASNVANNLKHLGCEPILCGIIGKSFSGKSASRFIEMMNKENISTSYIVEGEVLTTTKSRVIINRQQVVRFDYEDDIISNEDKKRIKEKLFDLNFDDIDLIIVSDYNKGVINKEIMSFLKSKNKIIIVDPKPIHKELYKNVFCLTPNLKEFNMLVNKEIEKHDESFLYIESLKLIKYLRLKHMVVTMGDSGSFVCNNNGYSIIPGIKKEVVNTIGAGDTFVSAFSISIACGNDIYESVKLANFAASIAISKEHTGICSINELNDFYIK